MIPVARPAYMGKKGRPSGRPLFMYEKLTAHIANPPARGGGPGKGFKPLIPRRCNSSGAFTGRGASFSPFLNRIFYKTLRSVRCRGLRVLRPTNPLLPWRFSHGCRATSYPSRRNPRVSTSITLIPRTYARLEYTRTAKGGKVKTARATRRSDIITPPAVGGGQGKGFKPLVNRRPHRKVRSYVLRPYVLLPERLIPNREGEVAYRPISARFRQRA